MKIVVDADGCIASGVCVHLAPDVFDSDPEGRAVVWTPEPSPAAVLRAARNCPAGAIAVDGVVPR